jgi:hypothetical protein
MKDSYRPHSFRFRGVGIAFVAAMLAGSLHAA